MNAYHTIAIIDTEVADKFEGERATLLGRMSLLWDAVEFEAPHEWGDELAAFRAAVAQVAYMDDEELEGLCEDLERALVRLEAIQTKGTASDHLSEQGRNAAE